VLLTYEKPAAFEVSPGIVFGGNRPLGFISVAACCCHSRGLDDLRVIFISRRTAPFRLGTSGDLVRLSQVLQFEC